MKLKQVKMISKHLALVLLLPSALADEFCAPHTSSNSGRYCLDQQRETCDYYKRDCSWMPSGGGYARAVRCREDGGCVNKARDSAFWKCNGSCLVSCTGKGSCAGIEFSSMAKPGWEVQCGASSVPRGTDPGRLGGVCEQLVGAVPQRDMRKRDDSRPLPYRTDRFQRCEGPRACTGSTFVCPPGDVCSIYCYGDQACSEMVLSGSWTARCLSNNTIFYDGVKRTDDVKRNYNTCDNMRIDGDLKIEMDYEGFYYQSTVGKDAWPRNLDNRVKYCRYFRMVADICDDVDPRLTLRTFNSSMFTQAELDKMDRLEKDPVSGIFKSSYQATDVNGNSVLIAAKTQNTKTSGVYYVLDAADRRVTYPF